MHKQHAADQKRVAELTGAAFKAERRSGSGQILSSVVNVLARLFTPFIRSFGPRKHACRPSVKPKPLSQNRDPSFSVHGNRQSTNPPDLGRRTRREADTDDDADDMQAAPAAPTDMYVILGFRQGVGAVTTQQWLSMRLLEF